MRFRVPILLVSLAALAWSTPAKAEWLVVPPRAGQVGLSVQGQYGGLLKTGSVGKLYESGPGVGVRLRYRMRYERAMGLSFESQRFDVRQPAFGDTMPNHMSAFTYGFEVYQMMGTRTRTTKWASAGAGLVQFRRVLNDKEIDFADNNDGVYVSAGAGVEHFVWQSWALDLSGRYLSVFQNGKANHDFQAALGVVVYATY
jgi:opacity protein-like surface antigen